LTARAIFDPRAAEPLREAVRLLRLLPDGLADCMPQAIGEVGILISVLGAEGHFNGNGRPVNYFETESQ